MSDSCPLSESTECALSGIKEDVAAIRTSVSSVKKDLDIMDTKVTEHHKTLYGNGHEGMKTTLTKVGLKTSAILWLFGIFITLLAGNIIVLLLTHGATP